MQPYCSCAQTLKDINKSFANLSLEMDAHDWSFFRLANSQKTRSRLDAWTNTIRRIVSSQYLRFRIFNIFSDGHQVCASNKLAWESILVEVLQQRPSLRCRCVLAWLLGVLRNYALENAQVYAVYAVYAWAGLFVRSSIPGLARVARATRSHVAVRMCPENVE